MTHAQAFHTSCRSGLGAHSGFQFNAATPSLGRELLARLASKHTGYHAPRDMPLEPGPADLPRFPVALKVSAVEGVGIVASRTTYVGREFRGRNGSPDEGRYGNYFSHIVVGAPGEDPFGGLLGIELWDAAHWTDTESSTRELPALGRLVPGPLDVDRVMQALATVPAGLVEVVLEAAADAIDGGPRLVIVDADASRAAPWIGWVSFALPEALARRVTFTTFDGRPRYADDVHVCVTTPSCDTAFAAHELGRSIRLVDIGAGAARERASLYARVAAALAARGTDALAAAVRAIPDGGGAARRGALLAVAGQMTELVEGDELGAVVDLLRSLTERGDVEQAAATARELPADTAVDRASLPEWAALHRAARERPADEHSRALAATALARIVPFAGELPRDLPEVAHDAPTQPAVANLAPWLSAVEAATERPDCGGLIQDGMRLGLVGVNAAVDRRLGRVLVAGITHESVRAALQIIGARAALDHIVVSVTEELAERAPGDRGTRAQLAELSAHPAVRATLRRRASDDRRFGTVATWLRVEVGADPSRRGEAATQLAALAVDSGARQEIRELWGPDGPQTERDHTDLLNAYLSAGVDPSAGDIRRACEELMRPPLRGAKGTDPLGVTLGRLARTEHPAYAAWWVAVTRSDARYPYAEWAATAASAIGAGEVEVPQPRWQELWEIACESVVREHLAHDYARGVATLLAAHQAIDEGIVHALVAELNAGKEGALLVGHLFGIWKRLPGSDGAVLVERVLPQAIGALKRRELEEVPKQLPPGLADKWAEWLARHPPKPTVGDSVARVFGRGRKQKDREFEQ